MGERKRFVVKVENGNTVTKKVVTARSWNG